MPNRTKLLKIRVTPEEKTDILDFMEESREADSISDFGRLVILRHIDREDSDEQPATIDVDSIVDGVETATSDLSDRLEDIEQQVATLASKTQLDEEAEDLAHQLHGDLMYVEPGGSLPSVGDLSGHPGKDLRNARRWGTAHAFADYYEVDVDVVRRALVVAEDWFPAVDYHREANGTLRYYRRTDTSDDYYIPDRGSRESPDVKPESELEDS